MENVEQLKITVVGAGALGGYYGALIAKAGFKVDFLVREGIDLIRERGWIVESIHGNFELNKPSVYNEIQKMPPSDYVLIATKSTANSKIIRQLSTLIHENTVLVNLQNGLGFEEELQEAFPNQLIVGGLCFLCSNKKEPGYVCHLDYGAIKLAPHNPNLWKEKKRNTTELKMILDRANIENSWTDSLPLARWQKLVWNIPYNGLCSLYNADTEVLIKMPGLELWVRDLMIEVQRGAATLGLRIDNSFIDRMLLNTRKMVNYKPSMLLDQQNKRPLELEYMYWKPVQIAQQKGFEMLLTKNLARQLGVIDSGKYQPESPISLG